MQSKLADPEWLQNGLDSQASFGREWEARVVTIILRNLSPVRQGDTHASGVAPYRKQLAKAVA